jgi:hypothetical protein
MAAQSRLLVTAGRFENNRVVAASRMGWPLSERTSRSSAQSSDLNNVAIAVLVSAFLADKRLD